MNITFDNSIWISLGIKGTQKLAERLKFVPEITIWENAPTLYESAWHWGIRGRNDLAKALTRAKKAVLGNRMIPESAVIMQRAIAQSNSVRVDNTLLQQRVRDLLLQREDMLVHGLRKSLRRRIAYTKMQFVGDVGAVAKTLLEEIGISRLTDRQFDRIFGAPETRQMSGDALRHRFQIPRHLHPYCATSAQWASFPAGKIVTQFYEHMLRTWCVGGRSARHQDFFDLEVLICSTGIDVLVTNNVKDFQRREISGLTNKLWTLRDLENKIGRIL